MNRPTRFLLHFLIGICAITALADETASTSETGEQGGVVEQVSPMDMPETTPEEKSAKADRLFWAAQMFLNSGKPEELSQGRSMMEASALLGNPHALFEMGRHFVTGLHGRTANPEEGLRLFIKAAGQKHGFAMVAAGQCYHEGTGAPPDDAQAERWLLAALGDDADFSTPVPPGGVSAVQSQATVAGGFWIDPVASTKARAHYFLGRIAQKRSNPADAHTHFVAAASAGPDGRDGFFDGAREAAFDFALGRGTPRDPAQARAMIEQARSISKRLGASQVQDLVHSKQLDEFATADTEELIAKAGDAFIDALDLEIAARFSDKKSKDHNLREAIRWLEFAAERKSAPAIVQLALLHGGGELGGPDLEAAFRWWEMAGGGDPALDTLAAANLAICLQNGIGTARDAPRAAAIFARYKDEEFLCELGTRGVSPKKVQSPEQAKKLLESFAKKKDPHAQYHLGLRVLASGATRADYTKAVEWFAKAAKKRHPGAIYMLGVLVQTGRVPMDARKRWARKAEIEYFEEASKLGNADAAAASGEFYHTGNSRVRNLAKAERFYKQCAGINPRHGLARNNLGAINEERLREAIRTGRGEPEGMRDAMLRDYEAAAALGYAFAESNLGRLFLEGELVPSDHARAYNHFLKAAEGGVADAHYQLGLMHERGQGIPVTYLEAAYHHRIAAMAGHREAVDRLIDFYLTGKGVARDDSMAEYWILRAVDLGNTTAIVELADGKQRRGDHAGAFALYQKMAYMPDYDVAGYGFERLSTCYKDGIGVGKDRIISQGYFELAVDRGNPDALTRLAHVRFGDGRNDEGVELMTRAAKSSASASYSLGQMYFFGTNVEKSRTKAMEFMHEAARMRYAKAMFFLAAAAFNREPEAPEIDEAIRLAESAENMGMTEATALREKLERRRDKAQQEQEQIARARAG